MIIVIQCAASKRPGAGHLVTADGKPVDFVADPQAGPHDPDRVYARPDDLSGDAISWRRVLLKYNEAEGNPLGLYPAYRLYENKTYGRIADRVGLRNLFILSAGWGLIAADFLTPITTSPSARAPRATSAAESQTATTIFACCRMIPTKTSYFLAARITFRSSARSPVRSEPARRSFTIRRNARK